MKLRIVLASLLLSACVQGGAHAEEEMTTLTVLTPVPRTASWYPVLVGEALGYFKKERIELDIVPAGDLPLVAFLQSGKADIASMDATEVIRAQELGLDLDVVYEVMHGAIEGIFVLESNPAASLAALKGTTIGIVGESDRSLLLTSLRIVGLTESDVTIVVLGESAPLLANSLKSEQVSAVVGAASDLIAIRSQNIDVKSLLPPEIGDQPANSFVMMNERIKTDGEVMQRFFRAWAKSVYAAKADPETVTLIAKKAVPENWLREDLGKLLLEMGMTLNAPKNGIYGELRGDIWTNIQANMLAAGEIKQVYDNASFLNAQFLDAANGFDKAQVTADLTAWRGKQ